MKETNQKSCECLKNKCMNPSVKLTEYRVHQIVCTPYSCGGFTKTTLFALKNKYINKQTNILFIHTV